MSETFSLGIKFKIKDSKIPKDFEAVHLSHTDGRDAFYYLEIAKKHPSTSKGWTVILNYGKNGTGGTKEFKNFDTKEDARKFFNQKMKDKIKRGYKIKNNI